MLHCKIVSVGVMRGQNVPVYVFQELGILLGLASQLVDSVSSNGGGNPFSRVNSCVWKVYMCTYYNLAPFLFSLA